MRRLMAIAVTIPFVLTLSPPLTYAQNDVIWRYGCGCPPPPAPLPAPGESPPPNYPHCKPGCVQCLEDGGTYTVLGCIPSGAGGVVNFLLSFMVGIGGGVAFLFMVAGAFRVLTSQGDPQALRTGKGVMTGAVIGILVIVFSVVILRIIGVDILRLPGFEQ